MKKKLIIDGGMNTDYMWYFSNPWIAGWKERSSLDLVVNLTKLIQIILLALNNHF